MDLDIAQAVSGADAVEGPDQVPRLDRPPGPCSEDQAHVLPGLAQCGPGREHFTAAQAVEQ
jgi:hypothetical protein